ncbi:MAG: hypothetical protein V9E96_03550 [Chitinophagaceae bacterium]
MSRTTATVTIANFIEFKQQMLNLGKPVQHLLFFRQPSIPI